MNLINIINEEIEKFALNNRIKCIEKSLETELKKYASSNDYDDRWFELRQEHRKLENYLKYGAFSVYIDENNKWLNNFTMGLNYSENNTYKRGEDVSSEFPDLKREGIDTFKAYGDKILFRGVSVDDWKRIQSQGYIDSDMRGAIVESEGINLAQTPSTAQYYLPHNDEGVILAVNPQGLNLYILTDEYIRVFEPIPLKNIVKVSNIITKNDMGSMLSTNSDQILKNIEDDLNKLDFTTNC